MIQVNFRSEAWRATEHLRQRFADDTRGVVAIVFALCLIPILGIASLAIDYGRASQTQTALQQAIDSGIYAARRVSPAPDKRIEHAFQTSFKANLPDGYRDTDAQLVIDSSAKKITAEAKARVPTTLMALVGRKHLDVAARAAAPLQSEIIRARPRRTKPNTTSTRATRPRPRPNAPGPQRVSRAQAEQAVRRMLDDPRISPRIRQQVEQMLRQAR
ncbi:MAG: pilus assembly protein TadG-related protein [Pseudomonadota bacterium]